MTYSKDLLNAQSIAATKCLDILASKGLIGSNLVTKLTDARSAILEALPLMYQACRQVEAETGKNMRNVALCVVKMFGRAKWADHNTMMTNVAASLRALVLGTPLNPITTEDMMENKVAAMGTNPEISPFCSTTAYTIDVTTGDKQALMVELNKVPGIISVSDGGLHSDDITWAKIHIIAVDSVWSLYDLSELVYDLGYYDGGIAPKDL